MANLCVVTDETKTLPGLRLFCLKPVIFKTDGPLVVDEFLQGHPRWSIARRLTSALVTVKRRGGTGNETFFAVLYDSTVTLAQAGLVDVTVSFADQEVTGIEDVDYTVNRGTGEITFLNSGNWSEFQTVDIGYTYNHGGFSLLMYAGALTANVEIAIPAGTGEYTVAAALDYEVPAGTQIRWRVDYGGAFPGDFAEDVSLTLSGEVLAVPAPKPLTVRWVHGQERMTLYTYTPATHALTETQSGLAASRATYGPSGGDNVWTVNGSASLSIGSALVADEFRGLGSSVLPGSGARIEFWIDNRRVAVLDETGRLAIPQINTVDSITSEPDVDHFEFFNPSNQLVAVLDETGLHAVGVEN